MPSPSFVVKLYPDVLLHRIMMGSGVILSLAGILLLINMAGPMSWRVVATVVWSLDCALTLRRLAAGQARVKLITLDSEGGVRTKSSMGVTTLAALQSGSFILARVAWLRIKDGRGGIYAGLFIQSRMNAADWHRIQLLWRQSRRAFGHPAGP